MFSGLWKEIYTPVGELDIEMYRAKREGVPFEERKNGECLQIKKGDKWGSEWDSAWFHMTGTVPETAKGKKVVLYMDVRGEMCIVDQNGIPIKGITSGSCFELDKDIGCFAIRKRVFNITNAQRAAKLLTCGRMSVPAI